MSNLPHQPAPDKPTAPRRLKLIVLAAAALGLALCAGIWPRLDAQAALEASEANVEQVRLNVTQGVWDGYYSLDSSNQQITVTSGLIKTAEQNEQVALGRYQGGVGTILDVLTAEAAAALARQTRIAAELAWQTARAQLAFALGRLSGAEPLSYDTPPP